MEKLWNSTFAFCILAICFWNFNSAIEATSFSLSLPVIVKDVHANNVQGFWAVTAFQLCSTVLQPISTSASRIFGRKPIVLLGISLFTLGAILASISHNATLLIVGRCIQGSGGGALLTMTFVVLTDLVSLRERGKWVGLISLIWLIGALAGPIFGGVFSEKVSWRWIFWLSLFFSGISFLLIVLFFRIKEEVKHEGHVLRDMDWFGAFVFVSSLTSLLVSLSWGGISYPWSSMQTLVPLILGVLGLISWVFFEQLATKKPMIPLRILKTRTAAVTYFGVFIHGMTSFISVYYLPLYFQSALSFSPIKAGIALLPFCVSSGLMALFTGTTIARTGLFRWAVFGGWTILILGTGLLQLLTIDTTTPKWIFITATGGLGSGLLFTSLSSPAQASALDEDMSTAAGLCPFFRSLGQACGIVIGDAIFLNQMKKTLSEYSDTLAKNALELTQIIKTLPTDSLARVKIVEAFVQSLKVVWWAMLALALLAGLLSLLTRDLTLDRAFQERGSKDSAVLRASSEIEETKTEGELFKKGNEAVHKAASGHIPV